MSPRSVRTQVLVINPREPEADAVAAAAAILSRGGLVAFPTETVYGLGASALDAEAVRQIFAAKGRPATNPLIVHVSSVAMARELVTGWPPLADALAAAFWPGPLTLVLPKARRVPDVVTAGAATVALRMPQHPVALALLRASGVPIAAPSANRSTRISPTRVQHVLKDLSGLVDLILDGGPTSGGIESTVLDLTDSPPRILRPGLVSPEMLRPLAGTVAVADRTTPAGEGPERSPGRVGRHYAPRVPLECTVERGDARVAGLTAQGAHVGWLTLAPSDAEPTPSQPLGRPSSVAGPETPAAPRAGQRQGRPAGRVTHLALPADPAAYAAGLYAALHELESAGVARIVVELPPDTEEWLAVRDRLLRAAVPPADQPL